MPILLGLIWREAVEGLLLRAVIHLAPEGELFNIHKFAGLYPETLNRSIDSSSQKRHLSLFVSTYLATDTRLDEHRRELFTERRAAHECTHGRLPFTRPGTEDYLT